MPFGVLSTFTISAGRLSFDSSGCGTPLSGAAGGGAVVVVRLTVVVVVSLSPPPLQAEAASETATAATRARRSQVWDRMRLIRAPGALRCARRGAGGCRGPRPPAEGRARDARWFATSSLGHRLEFSQARVPTLVDTS